MILFKKLLSRRDLKLEEEQNIHYKISEKKQFFTGTSAGCPYLERSVLFSGQAMDKQ